MQKYKALFLWWIVVLTTLFGVFWADYFGLVERVWVEDVTMFTSIITAIFTGTMLYLGWLAWKVSRYGSYVEMESIKKGGETCWFISEQLMALGMLGTVIGLIHMFTVAFGDISNVDQDSLTKTLSSLWIGLGIALFTNAAGLITSIIVKFTTYFVTYDVSDS